MAGALLEAVLQCRCNAWYSPEPVRRQSGNAAEAWHEQQYLAADGFVVSLQNSINAERIANIVGWGKVVGCIASTIGVDAYKAGHVMRTQQPGGST